MVREVVGTKRLIYRDDKKDTFHVYTPQELEQERQINLIFKQAISLYKLALELLGKARTAYANRNFGEAQHWDIQSRECELRGRAIEEGALRKHLEFLEGIGRVEGWEIPD